MSFSFYPKISRIAANSQFYQVQICIFYTFCSILFRVFWVLVSFSSYHFNQLNNQAIECKFNCTPKTKISHSSCTHSVFVSYTKLTEIFLLVSCRSKCWIFQKPRNTLHPSTYFFFGHNRFLCSTLCINSTVLYIKCCGTRRMEYAIGFTWVPLCISFGACVIFYAVVFIAWLNFGNYFATAFLGIHCEKKV